MSSRSFIKSDFLDLDLEHILKSPPGVLLGVTPAVAHVLVDLDIHTVFDLGMSPLFNHAARLVDAGGDVGSTYRKFGRAPAGLVDKAELGDPVAALPWEMVAALVGVGPGTAPDLDAGLSARVAVRDLALWPPYLAAKAIIVEAYDPDLPERADGQRELVPVAGEFGTERHVYSSVVMFPGTYTASKPLNHTLFDISATELAGFSMMRFGAQLTFSQTWFPKYVAKGQLLHSLPLAPGESTNVAVIDWTNKSKAATEQAISESERLASTNDRTRTVSQIANGVANDFASGSSTTTAQAGSFNAGTTAFIGIGVGNASVSGTESSSSTHVVSTGSRAIASTLQQNIVDSTQQNSSDVRSQRAAVVSEVSQSDTRNFSTRNITNYNHMHALTFQYYEVVQIYETQVRQEDAERCIFIPLTLFDFTDERVVFKYLSILKRVALDYSTRTLLSRFERDPYGYALTWGFDRGDERRLRSGRANALLRSHGFIKDDGAGAGLALNYELQLNNVFVQPSRSTAPQSLVDGIVVALDDGSEIELTPSTGKRPDPVNAAFGGQPLSFGRIAAIRLKTAAYTPSQAAGDRLVRVSLGVRLRGESRFLDASFILQDGVDYASLELLRLSPPAGLESLQSQLMEHQLHYSQRIWLMQNPQSLIMQFAGLQMSIDGKQINLVDYITPIPLQVVGNYLVYRFTYEDDDEWTAWRRKHLDRAAVKSDMVAVPTGGVFAEAVLGRFNAAEELDITRFASWKDSIPPVAPTAISPVKFTEPALPAVPAQATFSSPIVSIQNPINLPAPTGLTEALADIVKGGSFPDVSGLTQSGDAAGKATEAASADSLAALKASGDVLGTLMTSIGKILQATTTSAIKTTSEIGAVLNKKEEENKKQQEQAKPDAGKGGTTPPKAPAPGSKPADPAEQKKKAVTSALEDAIGGSLLALLAEGLGDDGDTGTDATVPDGTQTIPADEALLRSKLITEPLFTDIEGFLVLAELIPDADLLDVMERRFATLDAKVDVKAKYAEVENVLAERSADLRNADRILYALRFQKLSVLPDDKTLEQAQIATLKGLAADKMAARALPVARRVNPNADAATVLRTIFLDAADARVEDLNQVAYVLATAYHESRAGAALAEGGTGISTDTVFTKDEYFFEPNANGKSSYNGTNGNKLAGDQLKADAVITDAADVTAWNSKVTYPSAQPDAVKRSARMCDFYRFIGRGLVQITGRANYHHYSNRAEYGNIDFEAAPQRVAELPIAARILVNGMVDGDFRLGKKLSDYVKPTGFDGLGARDIVNGDGAKWGAHVRDVAKDFKAALIINPDLDGSIRYL